MKLPHFLVVGAARSGTTSLHYYLRQHPQLFIPALKEPSFFTFARDTTRYKKGKFSFVVRDFKKYEALFKDAEVGQQRGEISTPYLYRYTPTIHNIYKYHPQASELKILILLRNPADRAFSQYAWRVRDGREPLNFEEALGQEKVRMKKQYSFDYFYFDRGLYYEQVKAYYERFSKVKVVLFDDLKKDPEGMLRMICRFLEVDDSFIFKREVEMNASYLPRWKNLGRLVTAESRIKFHLLNQLPDQWKKSIREQFDKWNRQKNRKLELYAGTRKMLQNLYREDIVKLQSLIGRDLSAWLEEQEQ